MVDLSEARRNRYAEKLDVVRRRAIHASTWLPDDLDDEKELLASYKAFQEAVEAATDICAMALADTDRGVSDDYTNIERVSGSLLPEGLETELKAANGVRNRVVHEYNGFEAKTAVQGIQDGVTALERFAEEVESWLSNK